MTVQELKTMLDEFLLLPSETEWVEFKKSYYEPDDIGEYISALSNSASLHRRKYGYLVFGIENTTYAVAGTTFKPKAKKIGNEELESWLARGLEPRVDFRIHEFRHKKEPVVIFEIDAARDRPVNFRGRAFIRVGSYKKPLSGYPEKERKLWKADIDWSAQICKSAAIADLEPKAIRKARTEYHKKHPHLAKETLDWDDQTFLNKAKITVNGEITRTAIILLGREESVHHLSPSIAQISWILKDESNKELDYTHFGPPFLLNIEKVLAKIRNITIRHLPDGTLFPIEVTQYDPWVIREALHNAIAHQNYESKGGRVNVVETPDRLIFSNQGSFLPGNIEKVIMQDSPAEISRNSFLSQAMVTLNLIDTIGSGIKRMFTKQKDRYFPLPDFDLSEKNRVIVKIPGNILDDNYTRLLIKKTDLPLPTVILLDKVQKKVRISKDESNELKKENLVEGRYPNVYIASPFAAEAGRKAQYIKNRGFNEAYYVDLVIKYLREYGNASREDIDTLLVDKLPDVLSKQQKLNKINKLLSAKMCKDKNIIENTGSKRFPRWQLIEGGEKD